MKTRIVSVVAIGLMTQACSYKADIAAAEKKQIEGRTVEVHKRLKLESVSGVSASTIIAIGSIYLESQMEPLKVDGIFLQASDITSKDANMYVSYSSVDPAGVVIKKGAVEHVTLSTCSSGLLYTAFCLKEQSKLDFKNADIFATASDGTNLYAVGSTSDESASPNYARLYKVELSSGKLGALKATTILPSYAGTGVLPLGNVIVATSGTSTDNTRMGGLSFINPSTMAVTGSQPLYDARDVEYYKGNTNRIYVARGKVSSVDAGAVVEYDTSGASSLRTIASGGNNIAESKSSVQVGNELLLVSAGDQGFKVICKATGATLLSRPAVTVTGIPAARTVTNSVTAAPGYIFAANGEAGVYVYKFEKTSVLNSNYCQGVKATLWGRLSLDSDEKDSTYFDGELSANAIRYQTVGANKLLIAASGNKGISLINISMITIGLSDVDDF